MMNKITMRIWVITVLLLCIGCASIFRVDGPYNGKVIDTETKQPLEGVVVLGVWNKVYPNVAGTTSKFYDSIELLTDKNGDFKIPGKGLLLFSFLDEMDVVIYKAGYDMLGYGPWSSFRTRTGMKFAQWDGDKPIFLMSKLSREERKENIPSRPNIDQKRRQLLTDEINKERNEFGYNPL